MKAVILAAGRGERLEPLTETMPKCMLPLAGKPILEHIIEEVKKVGIDEITIIIGYKGEEIKNYFEDGGKLGVKINYAEQNERLGTAHALSMVYLDEDFLALNGDTIITS
ncbi:MAG: glucose-1-phosphate thymidylyltransferase, partial [Candidatus Hydrothermarchaeota archaeon]